MAETTSPAAKKATAKPDAAQYGPTYVVVWPHLSVYVPVDDNGRRPEEITVAGRQVKVVDEHIVLDKGAPLAAANAEELENLRGLASLGALQAAPAS